MIGFFLPNCLQKKEYIFYLTSINGYFSIMKIVCKMHYIVKNSSIMDPLMVNKDCTLYFCSILGKML